MAVAVSAIKQEIEKAKESLKSVDENIKKITGRDPNESRPVAVDGRRVSVGGQRGKEFGAPLGRRTRESRDDKEQVKDSEPPRKRVAVFSRLGDPAGGGRRVILTGRRTSKQEEPEEDEEGEGASKPAVQSSVVSTAKKITKSELISAQNVGEKGKARNRRMFGMLLGTLAKFADNQGRQTKQALKQKEVETRLEEETAEERKKLATERRTLFNERRAQQKRIQLLEMKVALANELVQWENEWEKKSKFIMTKASPSIFFMPTEFTPRTRRALQDSEERIHALVEKSKKSVEETMAAYDDEIKILDGKQDSEDGKRGGNGEGARDGRRHKIMGLKVDPETEEAMDLDSMEPQVDIKVEVEEGDIEPSGKSAEKPGNKEIRQNPNNQNHGGAAEREDQKEDTETEAMEEEPMESESAKFDPERMEQDSTKNDDSKPHLGQVVEEPLTDLQGVGTANTEEKNSTQCKMEDDGKTADTEMRQDKESQEPQVTIISPDSSNNDPNAAKSIEESETAEFTETQNLEQKILSDGIKQSASLLAAEKPTKAGSAIDPENEKVDRSTKEKVPVVCKRSQLSLEKMQEREKKDEHHDQRLAQRSKKEQSSSSESEAVEERKDSKKKLTELKQPSSDDSFPNDKPSRSQKRLPSSRGSAEKRTTRRKPESSESSSDTDDSSSSSSSEEEQKKRIVKSRKVDDRSTRHQRGGESLKQRPQRRSGSKSRDRDSRRRDRR